MKKSAAPVNVAVIDAEVSEPMIKISIGEVPAIIEG
jgi:hypothetical protein